VFDGVTGAQLPGPLGSFAAYNPAFTGGVYVAAADVNGDGFGRRRHRGWSGRGA